MRQKQRVFSLFLLSPSSRRAWIEIKMCCNAIAMRKVALLAEGVDRNISKPLVVNHGIRVALLAEGVDRNFGCFSSFSYCFLSPSSRRAWIEMGNQDG